MNRMIQFASLLGLLLLGVVACEYDGPDAVFDPDATGDPNPVISRVEPEEGAAPGVAKIKLVGENFSTNPEENQVFFGNIKVDIASVSSTELMVYRPNFVSDSLAIHLLVRKAMEEAVYAPYSVSEIGGKLYDMRDLGNLNTMIVDHDENIFVHSNKKKYYQVLETGEFVQIMKTLPRGVFDLKMGPEGVVYVGRDEKYLMQAKPGGTEFEKWAQGLPAKVKYIDFDANLNIYAGGKKSGIILVKPDESNIALGGYENHDIQGVRVLNGYLYVAAAFLGEEGLDLPFGIFRHLINNDGSLGEAEVFVDWTKTGMFADALFTDMEFDEDGILIVSTNGGPSNDKDPLMMVYPDGTVDTFYKGGLISGAILGLAWGSDTTLYYFQADGTLYTIHEMGMSKQCAPRYGRDS